MKSEMDLINGILIGFVLNTVLVIIGIAIIGAEPSVRSYKPIKPRLEFYIDDANSYKIDTIYVYEKVKK